MYGVFKKLNANDIKITPFEAHKQYSVTGSNFASNGIVTSSLYWSPNNKSTFTSESIKYFQIEKLYYRDYPRNRANLLEIEDIPYKKQERRLYATASVVSLPQYTFGNEIQPESITLKTRRFTFVDDGLGNLYKSGENLSLFPDEDNRVLYIAPVKAFKYLDLTIDPATGNEIVEPPTSLNGMFYDDSYFNNHVTYNGIIFGSGGFDLPNTNPGSIKIGTPSILLNTTSSRIEVEHRPYFNFDNGDFAISFWMYQSSSLENFRTNANVGDRVYILTKEGAINTPTNVVETNIGSNNNQTSQPGNNKYPYKIYLERTTGGSVSMFFERFDGSVLSQESLNIATVDFDSEFVHYVCQKSGSDFSIWRNGTKAAPGTDITTGTCGNKSNIVLFSQRNNDGSYTKPVSGSDHLEVTPIQHLMMWDKALSTNEVDKVYKSVTGTPYYGNVFYDNGFCVITHPSVKESTETYPIKRITYKNSYPITEYEYQCTVGEQEYNFTNNLTARKIPTPENDEYASFITGSSFKPYVTTIGLYDDDNNLLAVGKLAQPFKMSEETDTTFVIRFDK